ncbi:ABC transporter ATP-binding protein [Pleionea sediminis]|uniref:ABC transporter ATP-binding protein n=1 Tax=Pleionea sediminis TaxID=2569479 RepID=UPI0011849B05|nr:ABC transporter ATP-binding protein [Pleionea sediminis]
MKTLYKFFESLTQPFPPTSAEQPPKGLYAFCRYYTRGMEKPIVVMSITTVFIAVLEVSLFGFMGNLVDLLSANEPESFFAANKNLLIWICVLLIIALPVLSIIHANLTHQSLLGNFPMSIRWKAHRYLLGQSVSFFQNDFAGRVATKVMQTSLSVRETVMKLLDVILYITVYFTSAVVLISQSDYRLMLVVLSWFLLYAIALVYFIPRLKQLSAAQADARSLMTGRIVDSYSNISTVKLFAHSQQEANYAKDSMEEFLRTVYRQMRKVTGLIVSVQILNYLLVFAIGAVSIYLWSLSAVTVGAIAIAVSIALRLNGMSQWVMWEISGLFEHLGTVSDGVSTLSRPQSIVDKTGAKQLKVIEGKIDFENVTFHYGKGGGVIENLNLSIQPGEKIGLVGRSGAGKSTLVNLLLRFYDVEEGKVLIDGSDIKDVTQESLRSQIGMVTQDTALLHRSVRENVLYGSPQSSEEDLLAAIDKAEANLFIEDLVDMNGREGLDAHVGERGVKLSGGQRQRIAIARVLLKDAPILILDEATSALDSEVEAAIQESLYNLMEGKTVIAIAHRLSTIAAMDRLIVLDDGKIVEQGTHRELVDNGGLYSQLWSHQTGGFLGE